jgi:hypothetical protein
MLKMFGGILGILGGLGGIGAAFLFLVVGAAGGDTVAGVGYAVAGIIGGVCSIACLGLGIAVLATGGRFAGVLMLPPALIGTVFTFGILLLAVVGAILAAVFGETKPREESYDTRQSRLEKEVQRRYGARG